MTWTITQSSDTVLTLRSSGGATAVVSADGIRIDGSPILEWDGAYSRWSSSAART